ncbi:Hypothetical protein NCS54_00808400 [Fusarium falciforme]|uniref:Hypothetical protein n=1 Tax=Fusarium falciforme TaxID=195108 RepID=UPI0023000851|nr:Hypothetical protein NCS54_00808400 [Fusarium falciforme]WAO90648.1 Hypothetical protein NCS54_00808400 [Fusarium falciforme]
MTSNFNLPCTMTRIAPPSEEDYSHEPSNLSLCGDSYFFSGRFRSYGRVPKAVEENNELDFDHVNGAYTTEYIVLGPNERYFRCRRICEGEVAAMNSSDLEGYEEVTDFCDGHQVERPAFLCFGPNGTFYIRTVNDEEKWNLPTDTVRDALQVTPGAAQSGAQSLWLGAGGSWVVQYRDGSFRFDLRGRYAALERALRQAQEDGVRISGLALNPLDADSYACVFSDGVVEYEAGQAGFAGKEFEKWCEENFELKELHKLLAEISEVTRSNWP